MSPPISLTAGTQRFGSHKAPQYPSISVTSLYASHIYPRTQTPDAAVSPSRQLQKVSTARPFRAVLEQRAFPARSPQPGTRGRAGGTGTALSEVLMAAGRAHRASWRGSQGKEMSQIALRILRWKGPTRSPSPALVWMVHTGFKPTTLVLSTPRSDG